jgi:hypothetical protein
VWYDQPVNLLGMPVAQFECWHYLYYVVIMSAIDIDLDNNPALHNFHEDSGLVYINSHHLACYECCEGAYNMVFLDEPFLYCTNCFSIDVNF